jgi:hypothetical protein
MVHQQEPLVGVQLGQQRQQLLWLWDLQSPVGCAQQSQQLLHLRTGVVGWWGGVCREDKWQGLWVRFVCRMHVSYVL